MPDKKASEIFKKLVVLSLCFLCDINRASKNY